MLYKFNTNYINLSEIISLACASSDNDKYPYDLTIYLRDGKQYGVMYQTQAARDAEAQKIARAHNDMVPEPVTRYQVEAIVSGEVEKARRDFRRLREIIKEVQEK